MGNAQHKGSVLGASDDEGLTLERETLNRLSETFHKSFPKGIIDQDAFHHVIFGEMLPQSLSDRIFRLLVNEVSTSSPSKVAQNEDAFGRKARSVSKVPLSFKSLVRFLSICTQGNQSSLLQLCYMVYSHNCGTTTDISVVSEKDTGQNVNLTKLMSLTAFKAALVEDGDDNVDVAGLRSQTTTTFSFDEFRGWLCDQLSSANECGDGVMSLAKWLFADAYRFRAVSRPSLQKDVPIRSYFEMLVGVTELSQSQVTTLSRTLDIMNNSDSCSGDGSILNMNAPAGGISKEYFLQLFNAPFTPAFSERLFRSFDTKISGQSIDVASIACGISALCYGPVAERSKHLFELYSDDDDDKDGMRMAQLCDFLQDCFILSRRMRSTDITDASSDSQLSHERIDDIATRTLANFGGESGIIDRTAFYEWTTGGDDVCGAKISEAVSSMFRWISIVLHVIFAVPPQTSEQEAMFITSYLEWKDSNSLSLKDGDSVYLISLPWLRKWAEKRGVRLTDARPLVLQKFNVEQCFSGVTVSSISLTNGNSRTGKKKHSHTRSYGGAESFREDTRVSPLKTPPPSMRSRASFVSLPSGSTPRQEPLGVLVTQSLLRGCVPFAFTDPVTGSPTHARFVSINPTSPNAFANPNNRGAPNASETTFDVASVGPVTNGKLLIGQDMTKVVTSSDDSATILGSLPNLFSTTQQPTYRLQQNRLQSHVILGQSYDVVSEEVWRAFQLWYGGGPTIKRTVFDFLRDEDGDAGTNSLSNLTRTSIHSDVLLRKEPLPMVVTRPAEIILIKSWATVTASPSVLKQIAAEFSFTKCTAGTVSALSGGDNAHVPFEDTESDRLKTVVEKDFAKPLSADAKRIFTLRTKPIAYAIVHHKETVSTLRSAVCQKFCIDPNDVRLWLQLTEPDHLKAFHSNSTRDTVGTSNRTKRVVTSIDPVTPPRTTNLDAVSGSSSEKDAVKSKKYALDTSAVLLCKEDGALGDAAHLPMSSSGIVPGATYRIVVECRLRSVNNVDDVSLALWPSEIGTASRDRLYRHVTKVPETDSKVIVENDKGESDTVHISMSNGNPSSLIANGDVQVVDIDEQGKQKQVTATTTDEVVLSGGLKGLENLGNSCFLNASLQCISNTQPLTRYFLEKKHLDELNLHNPFGKRGIVAVLYGQLIEAMWCADSDNADVTKSPDTPNKRGLQRRQAIAPSAFREAIGRTWGSQFASGAQQDAQELLTVLLDGLHEDLNRIRVKPPFQAISSSDDSDSEQVNGGGGVDFNQSSSSLVLHDKERLKGSRAWRISRARERSIITDLFHGQLASRVTCQQCGKRVLTFDPFTYLSLPLTPDLFVIFDVKCIDLSMIEPESSLKVTSVRIPLSGTFGKVYEELANELGCDKKRLVVVSCAYLPSTATAMVPMPGVPIKLRKCSSTVAKVMSYTDQLETNCGQLFCFMKATTDCSSSYGNMLADVISRTTPNLPEQRKDATVKSGYSELAVLYHRKLVYSEGYFLSGLSRKRMIFGQPMALSLRNGARPVTGLELYCQAWLRVAPFIGQKPTVDSLTECCFEPVGSFGSTSGSERSDSVTMRRPRKAAEDGDDASSPEEDVTKLVVRDVVRGPAIVERNKNAPSRQKVTAKATRQPPLQGSPVGSWEFPFRLRMVTKRGLFCAQCDWPKFCPGCVVDCSSNPIEIVTKPGDLVYLAVDYSLKTVYLSLISPLAESPDSLYRQEPSVQVTRRRELDPTNLRDCLAAFTQQERLLDYSCSRCRSLAKKRPSAGVRSPHVSAVALKQLLIHRLPRVLVIHLKRVKYQNGRWVKSTRPISIPFDDFDPNEYILKSAAEDFGEHASILIPEATSEEDDNEADDDVITSPLAATNISTPSRKLGRSLRRTKARKLSTSSQASVDYSETRYKLYAILCHYGALSGGHYIAYCLNPNGNWYHYNDQICRKVSRESIDTDAAYLLFYERVGLQYDKWTKKDVDVGEKAVEDNANNDNGEPSGPPYNPDDIVKWAQEMNRKKSNGDLSSCSVQ